MSINYDNITVTCKGTPSKEALIKYYILLIDYHIGKYGKDTVRQALEELINED